MIRSRIFASVLLILCLAINLAIRFPPNRQDIKLPNVIKDCLPRDASQVVFLYGNISAGCPVGFYLDSIKQDKTALIVVPAEMTDIDVANLKHAFALQASIIKGMDSCSAFLKEVAEKEKKDDWKANVIIELKNGEVVRILFR
jgi:hypothetical protein